MKYGLKIILSCLFCFSLSACAELGIENPFRADPFTGGIDASTSELLGISLPQGLQRYPSHGFVRTGENGNREGLETFRGNVNGAAINIALFDSLRQKGWQALLSLRKGDRSITVYEKNNEFAVIAMHRQGMLTILEIWAGARLAPGTFPAFDQGHSSPGDAEKSFAPEEYGPLEESEKPVSPGTVERWGGGLEERDL